MPILTVRESQTMNWGKFKSQQLKLSNKKKDHKMSSLESHLLVSHESHIWFKVFLHIYTLCITQTSWPFFLSKLIIINLILNKTLRSLIRLSPTFEPSWGHSSTHMIYHSIFWMMNSIENYFKLTLSHTIRLWSDYDTLRDNATHIYSA